MTRFPAFVLLAVVGVSCLVPGVAEARTIAQSEARDARKAQRKQQKAQRKYAKAQRKAERKMLKTQRKYTTYRPHPL